jgi:hypothetical protein
MYNYFNTNMIQPSIVSFIRGDVTGDGIPDDVFLTGIKTPDSPFIQNITLVVRDGGTGTSRSVALPAENAGYNPTLYLNDFTGDGVYDILISITSGGSGGITYYYIYSFVNNIPRLIFNYNVYNQEFQYEVTYRDYYKVDVVSKINSTRYVLDISYKGPEYLSEIYNSDGKLKSPISGFVNPLSGLYPVDFDANRVYELLAFQKVAGRYNADSLGYIQNILKWENNRFILDRQFLAIFGAQV